MRVPITVASALLAILGLNRVAAPLAGPGLDALRAELAAQALPLEGEAARHRAVVRSLGLLARESATVGGDLRCLRAVHRLLARAFPGDAALEGLFSRALDSPGSRLRGERDELAAYLGDLPATPEVRAGREALARADALADGRDPGAGEGARVRRLERFSRALAAGWRASKGAAGWLEMEIQGGPFRSGWLEARAIPSGASGAYRLLLAARDGRTTGRYFEIAFDCAEVTGPGGYALRRPGEAVFRDFSDGEASGEEYTTRGGFTDGGTLVLTTFDPPGGVIEGRFSVTVSRRVDGVFSWFWLSGGEFRGVLR